MSANRSEPLVHKIVLAGLLGWIVPGLGHFVAGDKRRGAILLITMAATFWGGVAVAGVHSTIQPKARKAWFMAQICTGGHALATWGLGRTLPQQRANHDSEEIGIIYTGVVGLLNILVIIDAMAATDPKYVRIDPRIPPSKRGEQ